MSPVGGTPRLVSLGQGEAVGEGLLLDDSTHGTTARVIMPGVAVLMTRTNLDDITREAPQLYAALVARAARSISARLRRADATLWWVEDARWVLAGTTRAA
jgi:aspartate ammonia-lyase